MIADRCVLCGATLSLVLTIPNYPWSSSPVVPKGAVYPVGGVTIRYCPNCNVCATTSPRHNQITYSDDYTTSNTGAVDDKMRRLLEFIDRWSKPVQKTKALDIGCYDGLLTAAIRDKFGCSIEGCDPCAAAAKVARELRGIEVEQAEFSAAAYRGKPFDLVVARNVLEHVENPAVFLSHISYVLPTGGSVVLAVPDGLTRIREGVLGSIVPEHFWYFGPGSLVRLLRRAGFTSVHVDTSVKGTIMAAASAAISAPWFPPDGDKSGLPDYREGTTRLQQAKQLIQADSNIVLYGANTCTLELIASAAIAPEKVVCAIDDDPYKWGKALVNTDIEVFPREHVRSLPPHTTFVICSYYSQDALAAFVKDNAPSPSRVVTLYPEPRAVAKEVKQWAW